MPEFAYAAASTMRVSATAEALFDYLDDHRNLSAHMEKRSWAMMGSRMEIQMDAQGARSEGSRFGFTGSFLGVPLSVAEVVTRRAPPRLKAWATTGEPTLWVIGRYRMEFSIVPEPPSSRLTVSIAYDLPEGWGARLLGLVFGGVYARWCVNRMTADAVRHFAGTALPSDLSGAKG